MPYHVILLTSFYLEEQKIRSSYFLKILPQVSNSVRASLL